MFVPRGGTTTQLADFDAAIRRCRFDLNRITRQVPVSWRDLSREGALGLFWTDGRIEIDSSLTGQKAQAVFLAEAWHAIDQYLLTNGDRARLTAAAHPGKPDGHTWFDNNSYYASLGEMTMDVFLATFTDLPPTGINWTHPVNDRIVSELAAILGTPSAPPTTPPEPPAPKTGALTLGAPSVDSTSSPITQTQQVLVDAVQVGVLRIHVNRRGQKITASAHIGPN